MQKEPRQYRVLETIGRGGFGTVYRAELVGAEGFRKQVALKVLNANLPGAEAYARRLRDEARMLGLLRHRAVVRVDELLELDGRWTVVMEYVRGVDLGAVLRRGAIPVGPAVEIVEEVASALHSAYGDQGPAGRPLRLLHRDIKPSNIHLAPEGTVKLLDFGVARADFQQRESITQSVHFGSLGYMAPERLDGIDTHAGDIYALGAVLYELLVGEPLGRTSGNRDRHERHVEQAMDRLRNVTGEDRIVGVLRRTLAYDDGLRPTAREFARLVHAVRIRHPEPWLREWAEAVVPELLGVRVELPDELTGSILVEGGERLVDPDAESETTEVAKQGAFAWNQLKTEEAAARLLAPSRWFLVAGVVAGFLTTMGLGGGLLLAVWAAVGDSPAPILVEPVGNDGSAIEHRASENVLSSEVGVEDAVLSTDTLAEPIVPWGTSAESASEVINAAPQTSSASQSREVERSPWEMETQATEEPDDESPEPEPEEEEEEEEEVDVVDAGEASGKVVVRGGMIDGIRLVGSDSVYAPGPMPPGTYTVKANFGDGVLVNAGIVTVREGQTTTITCRKGLKRCTAR